MNREDKVKRVAATLSRNAFLRMAALCISGSPFLPGCGQVSGKASSPTGLTWLPGAQASEDFVGALIDLKQVKLRLFWKDANGKPFGSIEALQKSLESAGKTLLFATNAGIYGKDSSPLGLHVEDGKELVPLNTGKGEGNFFLQPNGVFFVDAGGAHALRTEDYLKQERKPTLAVQSGPMLLHDGQINPLFDPDSKNCYVRNAVGVIDPWTVVIAISRTPVTLYQLSAFLRDRAKCRNALYLDGAISALWRNGDAKPSHAPDVQFAGILGVVSPS